MANKRVSELAPIDASQLAYEDLLLLADVSAHESKKVELQELSNFLLLYGNLTGSLLGTASYAIHAATASYMPPQSASYAPTASWAINIATASYALAALSASYSLSGSYVLTASYALTSSVQFIYSSAYADYARSASHLIYTPGFSNGTASYAITTSYAFASDIQPTASYSYTSSWALNARTASHALWSDNSTTASYVASAPMLTYDGTFNGTASYALVAGTFANRRTDFGVFKAITQSVSSSQLDLVVVAPADGALKNTSVEAVGTAQLRITAGSDYNGTVELFALDRDTGFSMSLDSTPISSVDWAPGGLDGYLKIPFTLLGQEPMNGDYQFFVTASNVALDSRVVRFYLSSDSDALSVLTAGPMVFNTNPTNSLLYYTASSVNFSGSASQVVAAQPITHLLVPPDSNVNNLFYTWTLNGMTSFVCDNSPGISEVGGMPSTIVTMSAANCGLVALPSFISSSLSVLDCSGNGIIGELSFPPTMSYIKCSNNAYLTLPLYMPADIVTLTADYLNISYAPYFIPDTVQSMSFSNCPYLNLWPSPNMPTSLIYFSCQSSSLYQIPTNFPVVTLYVDVSACQMTPITIGFIGTNLVSNGALNGYLSIFGNADSSSAPGIFANVATLKTRGWTVVS